MNLYFLRGVYRPKSIKPFLGVLDQLDHKFSYMASAFSIVRERIEKDLYLHSKTWQEELSINHDPRINICIAMVNVTYGYLQTGRYHIYFGELAEYGEGKDLLRLYNYAADELVELGKWSKKEKKAHRRILDDAIATVG